MLRGRLLWVSSLDSCSKRLSVLDTTVNCKRIKQFMDFVQWQCAVYRYTVLVSFAFGIRSTITCVNRNNNDRCVLIAGRFEFIALWRSVCCFFFILIVQNKEIFSWISECSFYSTNDTRTITSHYSVGFICVKRIGFKRSFWRSTKLGFYKTNRSPFCITWNSDEFRVRFTTGPRPWIRSLRSGKKNKQE